MPGPFILQAKHRSRGRGKAADTGMCECVCGSAWMGGSGRCLACSLLHCLPACLPCLVP
jgi:hypothetical protein